MTGKRITLSDIAKKTGYSINTVSHALNNKSDISEETKKFIKETADSMGYIQNSSASFLRSGKSKCISVIVGDIANPHFAILVKEIEMTAKEYGYTYGQVKINTFFFYVGRSEIHYKSLLRKAETAVADGRLHPLLGFFYGSVGQAYDFYRGQAVGGICLNGDKITVYAENSCAVYLWGHIYTSV